MSPSPTISATPVKQPISTKGLYRTPGSMLNPELSERLGGTGMDPRGPYGQALSILGQQFVDLFSNQDLERLRKTAWRTNDPTYPRGFYNTSTDTIHLPPGMNRFNSPNPMHEAMHAVDPWDLRKISGLLGPTIPSQTRRDARGAYGSGFTSSEYFPMVAQVSGFNPARSISAAGPILGGQYQSVFRPSALASPYSWNGTNTYSYQAQGGLRAATLNPIGE